MTVGHVIVGVAIALIVLNVAFIAPLRMRLANGRWGGGRWFEVTYWESLWSSLGWTLAVIVGSLLALVVTVIAVGILTAAFESPL